MQADQGTCILNTQTPGLHPQQHVTSRSIPGSLIDTTVMTYTRDLKSRVECHLYVAEGDISIWLLQTGSRCRIMNIMLS